MTKFLVAVDGSDPARRAVQVVAGFSQRLPQSEVLLLHVGVLNVFYGELPAFDAEAVERAAREHCEALMAEALTHARACGLRQVAAQVVMGEPASVIVRSAEEWGADQIVMGTHGRGMLGSLFLGSVAQRVVHLSKVPVLLVK